MTIGTSAPGVAGGGRMIDSLAERMTPEQLKEAQARVYDWNHR